MENPSFDAQAKYYEIGTSMVDSYLLHKYRGFEAINYISTDVNYANRGV